LAVLNDPKWVSKSRRHFRSAAISVRKLLADPEIFRGCFSAILHLFIADLGPLIEAAKASSFHSRDVYEYIFAAVVRLNESVPFSRVEPLHSTCRHVSTPFYNRATQT
jgi:hypothetical protein